MGEWEKSIKRQFDHIESETEMNESPPALLSGDHRALDDICDSCRDFTPRVTVRTPALVFKSGYLAPANHNPGVAAEAAVLRVFRSDLRFICRLAFPHNTRLGPQSRPLGDAWALVIILCSS